jgi:hypothetical protein
VTLGHDTSLLGPDGFPASNFGHESTFTEKVVAVARLAIPC